MRRPASNIAALCCPPIVVTDFGLRFWLQIIDSNLFVLGEEATAKRHSGPKAEADAGNFNHSAAQAGARHQLGASESSLKEWARKENRDQVDPSASDSLVNALLGRNLARGNFLASDGVQEADPLLDFSLPHAVNIQ